MFNPKNKWGKWAVCQSLAIVHGLRVSALNVVN
jgi:hypothetical protein